MNAERLNAVLTALRSELAEKSLVENVRNLVSSLQAVVQSSNQGTQQNLASAIQTTRAVLSTSRVDSFSPTWQQVLKEIGAEGLFGESLKAQIDASLGRNQLTPAVALQELSELRDRLERFKDAVERAVTAFVEFKIGNEKLQPGECEIGVLIPREAVDNNVDEFAKELKELSFYFSTFSEVATGEPASLQIKTISSSDLLVFLNAHAPLAAAVARGIERVVGLYKQMLDVRKLHQDAVKTGAPEEVTKGLEEYANNLVGKGTKKIAVEIVDEFYEGKDGGRKNELKIAVEISLNGIANRIDKGFNIEVRCEPMTAQQEASADEQSKKAIAIVQEAAPSMTFLKVSGSPLLHLPESTDETHKSKGKGRRSKKEPSEHSDSD